MEVSNIVSHPKKVLKEKIRTALWHSSEPSPSAEQYMSSNGQPASTGPKKKRARKALEKRHKEPLPVYVNNESLTWVQYFVHALYTLIGYSPTTDRAFQGEYSREASCIWIRDKSDIQEVFCKGFFGKGNLSRSEPTWSQRVASEGNGWCFNFDSEECLFAVL